MPARLPACRYAAVLVAALPLVLTACGGSARSTKAFCSELAKGDSQLKAAAERTNAVVRQNALAGLIESFGGFGDFERYLDRLNKVAPREIQSDMKTVDDDFHAQVASAGSAAGNALAGNPGGLLKLFTRVLLHESSYTNVDVFANVNCQASIFGTNLFNPPPPPPPPIANGGPTGATGTGSTGRIIVWDCGASLIAYSPVAGSAPETIWNSTDLANQNELCSSWRTPPQYIRQLFNNDYTRMAWSDSQGNIGWVDGSGNFTNLTPPPKSDFSGTNTTVDEFPVFKPGTSILYFYSKPHGDPQRVMQVNPRLMQVDTDVGISSRQLADDLRSRSDKAARGRENGYPASEWPFWFSPDGGGMTTDASTGRTGDSGLTYEPCRHYQATNGSCLSGTTYLFNPSGTIGIHATDLGAVADPASSFWTISAARVRALVQDPHKRNQCVPWSWLNNRDAICTDMSIATVNKSTYDVTIKASVLPRTTRSLSSPIASPDGQSFAFVADSSLYVESIRGGNPVKVADVPGGNTEIIAWDD